MNQIKNQVRHKILLVEDDEKTAKIIIRAISQENFSIEVARDGKEALVMLNKNIDLIILDLLLPFFSGFDILKIIRKNKKFKMPVVVLSNLSQDSDIKLALDLGANDYLLKSSTSIHDLIQKIKEIISKGKEK